MSSKQIDSIELLRASIYHLFKTDMDYAEMFDVFVSGQASNRFWIYELTSQDGTKEMTIDYSINGGGGWLNVGMTITEFNKYVNKMLEWPLTQEIKETLSNELADLNKKAEQNKSPSV